MRWGGWGMRDFGLKRFPSAIEVSVPPIGQLRDMSCLFSSSFDYGSYMVFI